jgi:RNA polymerase sigma factor (sigma-70 family)
LQATARPFGVPERWNPSSFGGVRTNETDDMDDRDEVPDAVLAARASTGDTAAFGALVRRHYSAGIRLATVVGGSIDEAPDIVQEACVKAYRALQRQPEIGAVRSWMLRIVANEAHNTRRGRDRRIRRDTRFAGRLAASADDSLDAALVALDSAALIAAVRRLNDRDRHIIGYLSEAQTADVLGTAVGTVKSRTARALDRLRHDVQVANSTNGGER